MLPARPGVRRRHDAVPAAAQHAPAGAARLARGAAAQPLRRRARRGGSGPAPREVRTMSVLGNDLSAPTPCIVCESWESCPRLHRLRLGLLRSAATTVFCVKAGRLSKPKRRQDAEGSGGAQGSRSWSWPMRRSATECFIITCRPLTLSAERYGRLQRLWATASLSFDSQTLSDSTGGVAPGNAYEY